MTKYHNGWERKIEICCCNDPYAMHAASINSRGKKNHKVLNTN